MWTKRFGVWVRSRGHGVAQTVGEGSDLALLEPPADSHPTEMTPPPEVRADEHIPEPRPNPRDWPESAP